MKAIQVAKTGGLDVLTVSSAVSRPTAASLAPGQVLVRNAFSGVNFIDTYHRTGLYTLPLPFIPGREGAGVVEAVAPDVQHVAVGDRVAWLGPGSYAQYTAVNGIHVAKLPAGVSEETGAAALLQGLTALSLVNLAYKVQVGDTVLVHAAAGGTGGLLVQLAKLRGATVLATTSSDAKAAEAKRLGADHVIRYDKEGIAERVRELTNGKGVQAVFDGVGKATFEASLASLARRGFLLTFGNASGKVPELDLLRLSKGCVYVARPTLFEYIKTADEFNELASELFSLLAVKKLEIRVHAKFSLEQVAEAHKEIEAGKTVGKILLTID
ncbi:NADPH:quinone reductase [Catenaria anguillulae PL171]|uniref:Probable quinone oxidoreductase n=1 Tax=Catenaria anguillulae PL171 TaxID=765915 RepID=A0A1Y2HNJ9_9FUNG|nr:NADPH:quinone reductase [Catenaria anguillulae PL171]